MSSKRNIFKMFYECYIGKRLVLTEDLLKIGFDYIKWANSHVRATMTQNDFAFGRIRI